MQFRGLQDVRVVSGLTRVSVDNFVENVFKWLLSNMLSRVLSGAGSCQG